MLPIPSIGEVAAVAQSRGRVSDAPHLWRELRGMWLMWPGVETNNLIDWSGRGGPGSLANVSAADWLPGKDGLAINFSTPDSDVAVQTIEDMFDNATTTYAGDMTVAVWAKADVAPAGGARYGIFTGGEGSGSAGYFLFLEGTDSARFTYDSWSVSFSSKTVADVTEWNHYCGVKNGLTSTVYVNGIPGAGSDGDGDFASTYANVIGDAFPAFSRNWDGLIDDARIWQRALTAGEVRSLCQDPMAQVRFGSHRKYWFMKAPAVAVTVPKLDEGMLAGGLQPLSGGL